MSVHVDTGPTEQIVVDKFESSQAFAEDLWEIAKDYLRDLQGGAYSFSMEEADTDVPSIDTDVEDPADPPTQDLTLDLPEFPDVPSLDDISVPHVDIPSLDATSPSIDYPEAPSVTWPTDPGEPPVIIEPVPPASPDYTLPNVPVIKDLAIPPLPPLNIPDFEGTLPIDDIDSPCSIFEYSEAMYESTLKSAVENKLVDLVIDGGTGLAEDVEAAIWERARDRLALKNEQMYDEAEGYFASRGFNLPPGALSSKLSEIQKEQVRADQQLNYEISIEQARLAQTNTHFAITSVIQHEANVMIYITNRNNRMLDAAKYVQETAIAIFNAQVANYAKKLAAYQASAAVYESKIRASGLILENYKAQLEGVRLTAEIQRQRMELYGIQITAINALATLYRTEMEAVRIQADIERLKLEGFKGKVDAYTARLNGIVSCYNVYQAQIAGEAAKASVYAEQVRAYVGEVGAKKTEADINIAEVAAKIEKNKNTLEEYKTNILKANAVLTASVAEIEAKGRLYGYDVDKYKTDVSRALAEITTDVSRYQAESQHITKVAEVLLSRSEIFLREVNRVHEMDLEKAKTGATIAAQMAASAISAVAAGAQLNVRTSLSAAVGEYINHNLSV
jgi:hypothetical protein